MHNIIEQLQYYFSFPFVIYALIVGVLIALCSSLLGVTLVLKRYSYIGDGLSHVAFGAMAVASVLRFTDKTILTLPVTIFCAVLLLRRRQSKRLKGDSIIAMMSVSSLAFGYLLMNIFATSSNVSGDVCSTLFGSTSILTLTSVEVIICICLSVVIIGVFIFYYERIFAVTFDENFVTALGMPTDAYNLILAIMIAVIIVLGMNLVGSLLISALIIFPALSAMSVVDSFKRVVILAAIISVFCAFFGILASILLSTPVGSTIVAGNLIVFLIFQIIRKVRR